jgi:hypothetical protein
MRSNPGIALRSPVVATTAPCNFNLRLGQRPIGSVPADDALNNVPVDDYH